MSAKVVIVHSNPQPNRERLYPSTWLVYSQGQELEVHVQHDRDYRPHVARQGRGMKFYLWFVAHGGALVHRQEMPSPLQRHRLAR